VVTAGRRRRLSLEDCFQALQDVDPRAIDAPDQRAQLRQLLEECQAAGLIELSAAHDRGQPQLPRSIRRTDARPSPPQQLPLEWPWRAELAWASELRPTLAEFETLRAIQDFLRGGGGRRIVVAHRERSLELFGDEKAIDRFVRGRLFAEGRLSLDLLRCRWAPPPLAFERVGPGSVALVVENASAWHSCLATVRASGPVGVVAYGAGRAFEASAAGLAKIGGITAIRYAGDLDAAGLAIPIACDSAREIHGIPAVLPANGLWRMLIDHATPRLGTKVDPDVALELVAWLPTDLQDRAAATLINGTRLPQEAVSLETLEQHPEWVDHLD
jgi:hypothetical protein